MDIMILLQVIAGGVCVMAGMAFQAYVERRNRACHTVVRRALGL